MKKTLFIAALAIAALVSCSENDFVGDTPSPNSSNEVGAISFGTGTKAVTRADGSAAATLLNNNFVVEGIKTVNNSPVEVFDNYNVNWGNNTANTTTSNTANWEYVGQDILSDKTDAHEQSIKFWDYAASQYDFWAYSLGGGSATVTSLDHNADLDDEAYTITGTLDNLSNVYISDLVTAYSPSTEITNYTGPRMGSEVTLNFRSLVSKVRVGLFETIPGYSVKDVKFYTAANAASPGDPAVIYTAGDNLPTVTPGANDGDPSTATYIVYFENTGVANISNTDYNKAHVKLSSQGTKVSHLSFGEIASTSKQFKEKYEDNEQVYLGRSSNEATYSGNSTNNFYTIVLPNETGAVLNLKVDYTLLATDGVGETIKVTGATAQVPAAYAAWKSGYAYTYLFKISQNTNGLTNPLITDKVGLYPITLDAIVTEIEDGVQETITTVATPSITTYAKGAITNEYNTGSNIYIVVDNGTALTAGDNAKLYTVTLIDSDTSDGITTPAQTINEASVANALAHNGTVTDKNKFTLSVTPYAGNDFQAVTEVPAADAPDGNAITVNGAVFTPAAGTYAFEYTYSTTTYVAASGTYVAGTKYYTVNGATEVDTTGFEDGITDVSSYFVASNSPQKAYKIIKVVAAP